MNIAPNSFVSLIFSAPGLVSAGRVVQRALRDIAGDAAADRSSEIDWRTVGARALAILDDGDATAAADRAAAATGEFALVDLFPPPSGLDRADLNARVVDGLKDMGRVLGVSVI